MKKRTARRLPAKFMPQKIQDDAHALPSPTLETRNARAIAGLTGLVFRTAIFEPARSMAPSYDPARMSV